MHARRLAFAALVFLAAAPFALADIQAPPGSDHGPTRKLGRGLSNILFAAQEMIDIADRLNSDEGNNAPGYGVTKGVGRTLARIGVGVWEVLTFPFPTNKDKYTPHLRPAIPWIYSGYEEFPPELSWESRYSYSRVQSLP